MARLILTFALAFLVAACAGTGGASLGPTSGGTSLGPASGGAATPSPTPPSPVPGEASPMVNVVPQVLLDRMLEQASRLAAAAPADLTVESQEAVTWPDGSLGCPEPDMMYTQVLVDGYRVVIGFGNKRYDFRGTGASFRLCEPGGRPGPIIEIPPPPVDRY